MSEDIVLEEKEGWWCRECESVVRSIPGESVVFTCECIEPVRPIGDTPAKWVECKVVVSRNSSDFSISDESYICHCTSLPKNGKVDRLPSIRLEYCDDKITVSVDFLRCAHLAIISMTGIIRSAPADDPITWCVDRKTPVMEIFEFLNAEQTSEDIQELLSRNIKANFRP